MTRMEPIPLNGSETSFSTLVADRPAPVVTRVELLKLTRLLLEAGWCQKTEAENPQGRAVVPGVGEGVRWCLRGALRAATRMLVHDADRAATLFLCGYYYLQEILGQVQPTWRGTLEEWNDQPTMTQARVVTFLDLAIACLK